MAELLIRNQLFHRLSVKHYLILLIFSIISLPHAFCEELVNKQATHKTDSAVTQRGSNDCAGGKCNSEAEELLQAMTSDYYNKSSVNGSGQLGLKPMPRAKIIVLNKITAKSDEALLKMGELQFFGNLSIEVHKCLQNMDPYIQNSLMLLTIYDNKVEEDRLTVFHGWVVSSNPSISTLEHPVYEVIARKCIE